MALNPKLISIKATAWGLGYLGGLDRASFVLPGFEEARIAGKVLHGGLPELGFSVLGVPI